MKNRIFLTTAKISLVTLTVAMAALTGCVGGGSYETGAVYSSGPGPVVVVDDYDYYPGYEFYYSRTHHDYYYRDGNRWVRRPQPPGIRPEQLRTAPSVHMDFHDTPDRHHNTVIKNYPRTWRPTAPVAKPVPPPRNDGDRDHRPGQNH